MDTGENKLYIPGSYIKGEQFEDYVRKNIFIKDYYTIVERTHGYLQNKGDFIESSTKPDFKFRDKINNREFFIEAKFRSDFYNKNTLLWCGSNQLKIYQECNRIIPVFIALGVHGKASNPELLFLVPVTEDIKTELLMPAINKFKISTGKPVLPDVLWEYLKSFNL